MPRLEPRLSFKFVITPDTVAVSPARSSANGVL